MEDRGLNTVTPWSQQDMTDLILCAEIGDSLQTAAIFLRRSEDDIRQQALAFGVVLRDEMAAPIAASRMA